MILSETQRNALNSECETFGARLMQAAEKNNPEAIKAVQASQQANNPKSR
jgi:hypothetical protein